MILAAMALLACSRLGEVVPENDVRDAELIVRVTAVEYDKPPANPNIRTTGEPDSTVHFRVDEVVKGRHAPTDLTMHGYLFGDDDFNELPVPYHFVRRTGRAGSCFTYTYRTGGSYLLFLKWRDGAYSPNWDALAPLNEQLHGKDDPWIVWVRHAVAEHG
jgi:hypothetical protein